MPIQAADELRLLGHEATTARDLQLTRGQDALHLLVAVQRGWIVVTRDKDFTLLHDAWQRWTYAWQVQESHAGILLTPHMWLADQAAREVHAFFQTGQPLANRLYEWRRGVWEPF